MSFRPVLGSTLSFLLLAAACGGPPDPPDGAAPTGGPTRGSGDLTEMEDIACSLPERWLARTWLGHDPERSAEIQILPRQPNFVGAGLPHVGPWGFLSRVPMFWYGPGYIKPLGRVQRPVTSADIAATKAHLLGVDAFEAPDGVPMTEALVPAPERPDPPRLILTVIWDGAGRAVLNEWPNDWPDLEALIPEGAWYENATVGSSPTSSAQIHSTIGTGAFPRNHRMVGHTLRVDGRIVSPWRDGPDLLDAPTFGDVYSRSTDHRALIGTLGTVAIQLGMMSHGAYYEDGDRHLAVLRVPGQAETLGAEGVTWNLPDHLREYYRIPGYVNDLPPLASYLDEVDRRDGQRDGRWRGHPIDSDELLGGFHSPARVPYQTRLAEEVIEREGFGQDQVTDLLYLNYKLIDQIGHLFSANSREMKDSVRATDEGTARLARFLDQTVGEGRWVMLVTSDHGSMPDPELTGAFRISAAKLHDAIQEAFDPDDDDVPVAQTVKQTEIFIDTEELEEHGFTLDDVARMLIDLRQQDTFIPGEEVPDPEARVFRVAYPSEVLLTAPCLDEVREREGGEGSGG